MLNHDTLRAQTQDLLSRLGAELPPAAGPDPPGPPRGVVGVIRPFNFPVAVWSWNTALALVCGDTVVWKPSEKTMLTALACQALLAEAARRVGAPDGVRALVFGGP